MQLTKLILFCPFLGLGLGIIYLPRLDCITQYFDKRRPFVTGNILEKVKTKNQKCLRIIYKFQINYYNSLMLKRLKYWPGLAICGSGLGTFVFAPITQK